MARELPTLEISLTSRSSMGENGAAEFLLELVDPLCFSSAAASKSSSSFSKLLIFPGRKGWKQHANFEAALFYPFANPENRSRPPFEDETRNLKVGSVAEPRILAICSSKLSAKITSKLPISNSAKQTLRIIRKELLLESLLHSKNFSQYSIKFYEDV